MMRFYKQYVFSLFFLATFIILGLVFVPRAHAIPDQQVSCQFGSTLVDQTSDPDPTVSVTVDNSSSGACVLQFSSATRRLSPDATIFLQYQIDDAPCHFSGEGPTPLFGPSVFHGIGATGRFETVTSINVAFLTEGTHTIKPCYVTDTGTAFIDFHCLTVECGTDGSCPLDMVKVGSTCVDKYEAQVVNIDGRPLGTDLRATGNPYPCSRNGNECSDPSQPERMIFARSVAGEIPSSNISWFQAQQACANVGKRLLRNGEWQMAAAGTPDTVTANGGPPFCNVGGFPGCVEAISPAGSRARCVSNWGVFDMVGNLEEWVEDWKEHNEDRGGTEEFAPPEFGGDKIHGVDQASPFDFKLPAGIARGGEVCDQFAAGVFAFDSRFAPGVRLARGFRCGR